MGNIRVLYMKLLQILLGFIWTVYPDIGFFVGSLNKIKNTFSRTTYLWYCGHVISRTAARTALVYSDYIAADIQRLYNTV